MAWFRKPKYTKLQRPALRGRIPKGLWTKCPECLEQIVRKEWDEALQVCPRCNFHARLAAHERLEHLIDEGSFVEHDRDLKPGDPLGFNDSKPYTQRLKEAREKTGLTEGLVCGVGKIQGKAVSIGVMDYHFIGGSMGTIVGEKITRTLERGLNEKLPVILVCGSGGARMQEGILSLMQMGKTAAAAARLAEARVPLITVLSDPTTGGVTASFAMLGDVIIAEPNALIGFAGPRVIQETIKQILPPGFQRSEFVAEHGFIDIVCPRTEIRSTIGDLLSFFLYSRRDEAGTEARRSPSEPALQETPARG